MKVYAVAAWDNYYPSPDNVLKVFSSKEKAYEYYQEVVGTLSMDRYDILEYEVEV